jgi:hypothetical protein
MCQPGRPRPHGDLVELLPAEPSVPRKTRDAKIHVSIRLVCKAAGEQLLDQRDLVRNRVRSRRLEIGPAEPEPVGVLDVPTGRVRGKLGAVPGRRVVDLVVDVRDVDRQAHLVAAEQQPAAEPHRDDERNRIADVDPRVDRRAARVDADGPGRRRQLLLRACVGVIEPHRASAASPLAQAPRRRRPALARDLRPSVRAEARAGRRRRL